jgi:hypothetical protein
MKRPDVLDARTASLMSRLPMSGKASISSKRELLAIDDAGPAVKQRAERDVQWARQVMVDLGAACGHVKF